VKRFILLFTAGLLIASAPAVADPPATIPDGVTIAGVAVGGLTPEAATAAVQQEFQKPLALTVGTTRVLVTPDVLGATPVIDRAIERALIAQPNTAIPLGVAVVSGTIADFVAKLAQRFDRPASDSKLFLRHLRPWLSSERAGRKLDQRGAVRDINTALAAGSRDELRLVTRVLKPKVTRRNFGPVIVIRRNSNRLLLYDGMKFRRFFAVATGQSQYPTPLGRFTVIVKWKNPWWYPPSSPWAQGQKPIPPGPNNPVGVVWIDINKPHYGIHGTPEPGRIGYSASHGCVRLTNWDAARVADLVARGTPVVFEE